MKITSKWLQKRKQKSANKFQEEQSTTSHNTEEIPKQPSNSPTSNEELTGTPFRIVNIPEAGWFVTLGPNRITNEIYKTREEAVKPIHERDWNTICNVIVTLNNQLQEMLKQTANDNQNTKYQESATNQSIN